MPHQMGWVSSGLHVDVLIPEAGVLHLSHLCKRGHGHDKKFIPRHRICFLPAFAVTWLKTLLAATQKLVCCGHPPLVVILHWLTLCTWAVLRQITGFGPTHPKTLLPALAGGANLPPANHLLLLPVADGVINF